jgi:type IV pilus assembly protein PilA
MPGWVIAVAVLGALGFFGTAAFGIFAVLSIYSVRKYVAAAKMTEARTSLGEIARDATVTYAKNGELCKSASHSVPVTVPHAAKYQTTASEWDEDRLSNAGFACLGFTLGTPQYYAYDYKARGKKAPGDEFRATAEGDLDGDGESSLFTLTGKIDDQGALVLAPTILESKPGE